MSGCFYDVAYVATAIGLFHDWKMSGVAYNNYADSRVGSPITITSVYHDCSGDGGNSYWPGFGSTWRVRTITGIFHDNDTSKTSYGDSGGSRHYPLIYHSKIYIKIIYVNSFI